jgi:hypothetical protein
MKASLPREASMFELKLPESDESDDTPRAAHARLFRLAVRIGTFLAIWTAFSAIGAGALPRHAPVGQIRHRLPPGMHAWCDHTTGRCGIHDARHRPVGIVLP